MGFATTKAAVLSGIKPSERSLVFRNYELIGTDIERHATCVLSPDKCHTRLELVMNVNYTTVASDTSDVEDIIKFIDQLIPMVSYGVATPAPGTILNGVRAGVAALGDIFDEEIMAGTQAGTSFSISPCGMGRQDFEVIKSTLKVRAKAKVSHASDPAYDPSQADSAFAKVTMQLDIGGDSVLEDRVVGRVDALQANEREYAIINYSFLEGTQIVEAMVQPHCRVTPQFSFSDEIAAITLDRIYLIIESVPAEFYHRLPEPMKKGIRDRGVKIKEPPKNP